jgi:hypothetical protein
MDENGETRKKEEEEYWRQHHSVQPYARKDHPFEHYAPAYRAGVDAYFAYPDPDFYRRSRQLITNGKIRFTAAVGSCSTGRARRLGQTHQRDYAARSR